MKAAPLLVAWHNENTPIYSAHFEPHGRGRLATAGGDNNVRLWKVEGGGEDRKVTYLSTLMKHTQAVNVVRWCPRGELLGSAGDDGNVLLWVPSENPFLHANYGEDGVEDKETWRVRTMCRSSGSEIYDLAWSPDGVFFITGSMDNVARIYNAQNGNVVRQIAEHNHYVQGVAWDPLNEYIATQSSDRSVHIYTLKTKDGQFTLAQHNKVTKMELPARRISSNSPAPPDFRGRSHFMGEAFHQSVGSPAPSAPGTPQSLALPMNPPPTTHSRRSSFGSTQASRRSVSPSPSIPLPAVMPAASPGIGGIGYHNNNNVKSTSLYANETFTSFFRRLTFAPDGSLLFTPAGQHKDLHIAALEHSKTDDVVNMTYIYTRAGLNRPPVAKLPGHKKPSLAVKCSPVYYTLRTTPPVRTKEITIDTGTEEDLSPLPEPALFARPPSISHSTMDPPPLTSAPSPAHSYATAPSPKQPDLDAAAAATPAPPAGPPPVFDLPYRIVYAVATQDAVHVYDTQQKQPLCVVSNLHYATFTDLTWTNDGLTLLITSSDGFCSCLTFAPGELGSVYYGSVQPRPPPAQINTSITSAVSTPSQTPTQPNMPNLARQPSLQNLNPAMSPFVGIRPASPARSMSTSSIATQASHAQVPEQNLDPNKVVNNPTPQMSSVPSLTAASPSAGSAGGLPMFTPPQTPGYTSAVPSQVASAAVAGTGTKREGDAVDASGKEKRRRIQPTLVSQGDGAAPP